jgi:anti-sigma B factor antagonist
VYEDRARNRDGREPGKGRDTDAGDLTVEVVDERGTRVLRLTGELDIAVGPGLLPRVPELVAGAPGVVFDLSAVTFLDSAGVRLVGRLARECGQVDVPFAVVATPGTTPARLLHIVGFGPPMVVANLAAGLDAVRDPA